MGAKNKNKPKKIDLLQLSDEEKYKLIKQLKESLQQKIIEAKLWQSFLETENLTVNGQKIAHENMLVNSFSIRSF